MPSPSSSSFDSPKSDSPPASPITGLTFSSLAQSSRAASGSDFDFDGFLTTESPPSLLNEDWFSVSVDRETAAESGAPSVGGLSDQLMGFNLGSTGVKDLGADEKVEKVTNLKRPHLEISENASFTVQDRSRTDSPSLGSKEEKAILFDCSERRGSDGPKLFYNLESEKKLIEKALASMIHEDDKTVKYGPDEENSSAKRIRKECRENEECRKYESLPFDLNLDLNSDLNLDLSLGLGNEAHNIDFSGYMNEGPSRDDNGDVGQGRYSREEKGKGALDNGVLIPNDYHEFIPGLESEWLNLNHNQQNFDASHIHHNAAFHQEEQQWRSSYIRRRKEALRADFRDIAKSNASRFAHYTPVQEDSHASPEANVEKEIEAASDPFSTAIKSIRSRGMKSINWVPRSNQEQICARVSAPSLQELCLNSLAKHADAIVSLENVPDALKHRLSQLVCDSRKMNSTFLELLLTGSPTEVRLSDCSWMTEEQFVKVFQSCDTTKVVVLQLDQCGRCTSDYVLLDTLAQSPKQLPRLTSLSLRGACRLTDRGLCSLVPCVPALRSINLSQCSLLTSACVHALADSLGSLLKELYLDECLNIDAALIGPQLQKLEHLEVLSVAGIPTVSDDFIVNFVVDRGHNLKELVLRDCEKLTDSSVKFIAEFCPGLCSLDLMNLCKLTDSSVRNLANGCRALHTLRLCRNPFSDDAIAAFLETAGMYLEELSLNNVKKVGYHTSLSLASRAKKLHTLDLSWCRNFTDDHLGLIVDSCLSLRHLKIFGCTQITEAFMLGHSNREVKIIGCKLSPLLQHVKVDDPERNGALRYSPATDAIYM
ncbi:hypothetical protein QN277_026631 [Acacia crassicarpa]|uniref:Uncharacterized protein n=1 Tax=Acacia crassicarpa TaxID=499986 RepID=A0AAE1J821_9FABA|nr:hypothetical protein QN277_026631 [Acacia crassicarpa]